MSQCAGLVTCVVYSKENYLYYLPFSSHKFNSLLHCVNHVCDFLCLMHACRMTCGNLCSMCSTLGGRIKSILYVYLNFGLWQFFTISCPVELLGQSHAEYVFVCLDLSCLLVL